MTAVELRKIAKEHKIKLTKNGKYKTMKELKNDISNINNTVEGEGIKHLGRKVKHTLNKTHKIGNKISKTIDKYSPIIEMIAPELGPALAANKAYNTVNGGSLSAKDTKDFLTSSYSKELNNINGYIVDKSLSGQRVQVYHNPQNNKTVVVHRGTDSIQDWGTNLSMSLGHKGKRFNHAKKIQKQAEDKYGKNNLITLGHSQGAKWAEMLGNKNNNNEVITLNKPTLPLDLIQGKKVKKNQTDIKTSRDPVSILRKLQKGKKAKVMKSKTFNPLTEHGVDALNRLDENEILGVPETEGSGVPIRNFIYSNGFDPSKLKKPSKSIKNGSYANVKKNQEAKLNTIHYLKTLYTIISEDINELQSLTNKKDIKEHKTDIKENKKSYDQLYKQLKKYYDKNKNRIFKQEANKLNTFFTNKEYKSFLK